MELRQNYNISNLHETRRLNSHQARFWHLSDICPEEQEIILPPHIFISSVLSSGPWSTRIVDGTSEGPSYCPWACGITVTTCLPELWITGECSVWPQSKILDSQCHRGYFKYLTDWEVYGPEERSWVTQNDNLESTLITSFQVEHLTCPAVCICISSHSRSRAAQILNSVTESVSGFHQGHSDSFPSW